ncbi:uncharacterized protein DS421_16g568140 [Arachis hypogaea]|nr:uncharacterized protein DS421_16g568140 [Arachis hypogaea]
MEGVVSVFSSRTLKLHTTRSWDFMGFKESIHRNKTGESDVIIGVIDTGIWPESENFNDHGFGPIPKKWEAWNKVVGASFYGIVEGVARGGVPSARIAAYSVYSERECKDDAILAAFDDAISDGVDLITISIRADEQMTFDKDIIAIGSFHAMEKGILTINSVDNNGPNIVTFSVSPWLFTVAATTMDRRIIDKVLLGNGLMLSGKSINGFASNGTELPLIRGKFASNLTCSDKDAESCYCLDPKRIKGKIVLCQTSFGYSKALESGAFGSIFVSYEYEAQDVSYLSLSIDPKAYDVALSYANSTTSPYAEILSSASFISKSAPTIAEFSSVGPNKQIIEIMKLNISAPGIEDDTKDKRSVKYNILSGTSMACPHVAGIVAYVKTFHPDWSPAAIKSSIMMTAKPMNGSELAEFSYG